MQAPGPPAQTALRSFVAALALFDALAALTGRPAAFSLKWPNDVLLHGDKLAGILLETGGPPGAAPRLVIGFGVNLASVPAPGELGPDALPPASLRGALGIAPDPEEVLALLAPAVVHWEATLRDAGFAPLRTAWLARAARLGQEITARLPGRAVTGRFETIDATGALVLATSSGRIALPAAEVFFRATPEVADAARD
jgi:BirA family biotin operon repressor/biotin-[acetyl-CoA-carboxylase] ligase